ncbi:MAG: tRNA 2-selenouridine(34) synthase MnmH [Bdellovibrionaceae bacterium]|nr:tRNA 2-selenouridine(34) synthase MnmH [Pseudobdellovibrionaceae bacterium]
MNQFIEPEQYRELILSDRPIVDVRAPIEFAEGSLPGSVNLPILNNEERALVGTCYKQKGPTAAVKLGHEIVAGRNREEKIRDWVSYFQANPKAVLTCFRGGQRSGIAQEWLREKDIRVPRLRGGTKAFRNFLIEQIATFSRDHTFMLISGPTGSGKSHFLRACAEFAAIADLEEMAHHKGSAFGQEDRPQPTQIDFENRLARDLIKADENLKAHKNLLFLVEDESRMIGSCGQPAVFFEKLRQSPVIWLEVPIADRVQNIFHDYVLQTPIGAGDLVGGQRIFARYKAALSRIQKRLGGIRYIEILKDLEHSEQVFLNFAKSIYQEREESSDLRAVGNQAKLIESLALEIHKSWIEKLLVYYYDPLYFRSLDLRQPIVCFRGSPEKAFSQVRRGSAFVQS